ncbi:uncharacterized protein [Periplaneta americana]|uniref:uncharacterized protein isoform X2 n=1 Tax=Periplaneta americana TaxID=6978 RepID=UPI0037E8154E
MPRRNFAKLQKIKINKKRGQPTVSSFFNKISKPKEQSPAILNDPEANEESDVTENAFLAPKRQKYSSNTGELSGEKSQETKTPAISLSSKTLEKIKYFSAHHDASTSYEKMEYDDLGRKNEEDGKKNKIKLVDNHYSEHCLTASSFIETNNLSSAYNQSPRSPTKSCTTTSSGTNMKYTPLEQQVLELKRKHGGMILMIQTAYKYTFFGEDAEVASRVLNIMVTQHHNFLTAVIPTVRLHVHIRRLVEEEFADMLRKFGEILPVSSRKFSIWSWQH